MENILTNFDSDFVEQMGNELHESKFSHMEREEFDTAIGLSGWRDEKGPLDWGENVVRGMGERGADLAAGLTELVNTASKAVGIDSEQTLGALAESLRNTDLGYEEWTSWEDVKDAPIAAGFMFAMEQGLISLPDMLAVLNPTIGLPVYIAARTGEIGHERAQNNMLKDATMGDMLAAMPAATASALLDRLGARGILGITDKVRSKTIKSAVAATGRAAVLESGTEGLQETIEYAGASVGTKRGFDEDEALHAAIQGAFVGGVFGGTVRAGTAAVDVARDNTVEGKERRAKEQKDAIDASRSQSSHNLEEEEKRGLRRRVGTEGLKTGDRVVVSPISGDSATGNVLVDEDGVIRINDDDGQLITSFNPKNPTEEEAGFSIYTRSQDELDADGPTEEEVQKEEDQGKYVNEVSRLIDRARKKTSEKRVAALEGIRKDPRFEELPDDVKDAIDDLIDGETIEATPIKKKPLPSDDEGGQGGQQGGDQQLASPELEPEPEPEKTKKKEKKKEPPIETLPEEVVVPEEVEVPVAPAKVEEFKIGEVVETNDLDFTAETTTPRRPSSKIAYAKKGEASEVSIDTLKIPELSEEPDYTREENARAIENLTGKIKASKKFKRIIIDEDNNVISGARRVAAAKVLGLKNVPAVRAEDLSKKYPVDKILSATTNRIQDERVKAGKSKTLTAPEKANAEGLARTAIDLIEEANGDYKKAFEEADKLKSSDPALAVQKKAILDAIEAASGTTLAKKQKPLEYKEPKPDYVSWDSDKKKFDIDYAVVDLDSVIASHDEKGNLNPDYPQEKQRRDRSTFTSKDKTSEKIENFEGRKLIDPTVTAQQGAPIVDEFGNTESGNGRVIVLQGVYERAKENQKFKDYVEEYKKSLASAGFNTEGIARPVLVRVRKTPMSEKELNEFIVDANRDETESQDKAHHAFDDAGKITESMLSLYQGGEITSENNAQFVMEFVDKVVPKNERGKTLNTNLELTEEGIRRIEIAIIHKVFGNEEMTQSFFSDNYEGSKTLRSVVTATAAGWGHVKVASENGTLGKSLDITDLFVESVKLIHHYLTGKSKGTEGVDTFEAQIEGDLFGKKNTTLKPLIAMFFKHQETTGGLMESVSAGSRLPNFNRLESVPSIWRNFRRLFLILQDEAQSGELRGSLVENESITIDDLTTLLQELGAHDEAKLRAAIKVVEVKTYVEAAGEKQARKQIPEFFSDFPGKSFGEILSDVPTFSDLMLYALRLDGTIEVGEQASLGVLRDKLASREKIASALEMPDEISRYVVRLEGIPISSQLKGVAVAEGAEAVPVRIAIPTFDNTQFGKPWLAVVTLVNSRLKYVFAGKFESGNKEKTEGALTLEAKPGTYIAHGQKNLKDKANSINEVKLVLPDGSLQDSTKDELRSNLSEQQTGPVKNHILDAKYSSASDGLSDFVSSAPEFEYLTETDQGRITSALTLYQGARDAYYAREQKATEEAKPKAIAEPKTIAKPQKTAKPKGPSNAELKRIEEEKIAVALPTRVVGGLDGTIGSPFKIDEFDYRAASDNLRESYNNVISKAGLGSYDKISDADAGFILQNALELFEKAWSALTFNEIPNVDEDVRRYTSDSLKALHTIRMQPSVGRYFKAKDIGQWSSVQRDNNVFRDFEAFIDAETIVDDLIEATIEVKVAHHYMRNVLHETGSMEKPLALLHARRELDKIIGSPKGTVVEFMGAEHLFGPTDKRLNSWEESPQEEYLRWNMPTSRAWSKASIQSSGRGGEGPKSVYNTIFNNLDKYLKGWKAKESTGISDEEVKIQQDNLQAEKELDEGLIGMISEWSVEEDEENRFGKDSVELIEFTDDEIINIRKLSDERFGQIYQGTLAYGKYVLEQVKADRDAGKELSEFTLSERRAIRETQKLKDLVVSERKRRESLNTASLLEKRYKVALKSFEDPIDKTYKWYFYNLMDKSGTLDVKHINGVEAVLRERLTRLGKNPLEQLGGIKQKIIHSPASDKVGYVFSYNPFRNNNELIEALGLVSYGEDAYLSEMDNLFDQTRDTVQTFDATSVAPKIEESEKPSTEVQAYLKRGLDEGIDEEIINNQIEDVARIVKAFEEKKGAFVLATTTGSGKTFMLAGAVKELSIKHPELNFLYVTGSQTNVTDARRDAEPILGEQWSTDKKGGLKAGRVNAITYAKMRQLVKTDSFKDLKKGYKPPNIGKWADENTVLLFDEGHNIKNISKPTNWAAYQFLKTSRFATVASATPFTDPAGAQYLKWMGLFDSIKGGYDQLATDNGVRLPPQSDREIESTMASLETSDRNHPAISRKAAWLTRTEVRTKATNFLKALVESGVYISRLDAIDPANTENEFESVKVSDNWETVDGMVQRIYEHALALASQFDANVKVLATHRVNTLKRLSEGAKIEQGAETIANEMRRPINVWKIEDGTKKANIDRVQNDPNLTSKEKTERIQEGMFALPKEFSAIEKRANVNSAARKTSEEMLTWLKEKSVSVKQEHDSYRNRDYDVYRVEDEMGWLEVSLIIQHRQVVTFVETKSKKWLGRFKAVRDYENYIDRDRVDSETDEQRLNKRNEDKGRFFSSTEVNEYFAWYDNQPESRALDGKFDYNASKFDSYVRVLAMAHSKFRQERLLPSAKEHLQAELLKRGVSEENIVFFTGDESKKVRLDNKTKFNEGQARAIIVTMAAGGTGLSLHDTSEGGKRPRSIVGINLPWDAITMTQVLGRISRLGMTSKARIKWLIASNLMTDLLVGSRLVDRLQAIGFSTAGAVSPSEASIFDTMTAANKSTIEKAPDPTNAVEEAKNNLLNVVDGMAPSARALFQQMMRRTVQLDVLGDRNESVPPAVVARLKKIAQRIAPKAQTEFVRWIESPEQSGDATVIGGQYTPGLIGGIIRVAETLGPAARYKKVNMTHTLGHESLHYLRDQGLITPKEWAKLVAFVKKTDAIKKYNIRQRYPNADPDLMYEETIAEIFGDYVASAIEQRAKYDSVIKRAFDRIILYFKIVGETFGVYTSSAEDVMKRLESGFAGRRERKPKQLQKGVVRYSKEKTEYKPHVSFENAESEERFLEAMKGAERPSVIQRIKATLSKEKAKTFRHNVHLDMGKKRGTYLADLSQKIRHLEASQTNAVQFIQNHFMSVTKGLSKAQYDLFTRAIVLEDLVWSAEQGMKISYGLNAKTAKAELAKVNAELIKHPMVQKRLAMRNATLQKLRHEMIQSGVLDRKRLKNIHYFRHQVLEYAQLRKGGGGRKVATPFWHARKGSEKDINANYFQAESEWMYKAKVDIETARFLSWLRKSKYNKRFEYKARAKAKNSALVYSFLIKDIVNGLGKLSTTDPKAKQLLADFEKVPLNESPIALVRRFKKAVKDTGFGNVYKGSSRFKLFKQYDAFRIKIVLQLVRVAKASLDLTEDQVNMVPPDLRPLLDKLRASLNDQSNYDEDSDMLRLISWFANQESNGFEQLKLSSIGLFKEISDRRVWTENLLGNSYVNPLNTASLLNEYGSKESESLWQADSFDGKTRAVHMYTAMTVPEHIFERTQDHVLNAITEWDTFVADLGIKNESGAGEIKIDIKLLKKFFDGARKATVLGGPKEEMILPKDIAVQLNEFRDPYIEGILSETATMIQSKWKQWILFMPRRITKYVLNNITGDLDAIIGNPSNWGTFRHILPASRELWGYFYKGEMPSETLRESLRMGVISSAITTQEIPDKANRDLAKSDELVLTRTNGPAYLKLAQSYADGTRKFVTWREAAVRYASYLNYREKIVEKGLSPSDFGYGATPPHILAGVTDKYDLAALMARDAMGDYGNLSFYGRILRQRAVPFWSWQESNMRRYANLFKNAWHYGRQRNSINGSLAGAATSLSLFSTIFMFYASVMLWNHLFFGDDEDELSREESLHLHANLGEHGGRQYTIRFQGALSDVLGWLNMEDVGSVIQDVQRGRADFGDIFVEVAKGVPNRFAQSLNPMIKVPIELVSGKQFFPDVFRPSAIFDPWEHFARTFSLHNEYKALVDYAGYPIPRRSYPSSLPEILLYSREKGRLQYNWIRRDVWKWKEHSKDPQDRRILFRAYQRALSYGDNDTAKVIRAKLKTEHGVKERSFKISTSKRSPLGNLSKKERKEYLATLSLADKKVVREAQQYWYNQQKLEGRANPR